MTAKTELSITESMLTGALLVRLETSALGSGGLSDLLVVRGGGTLSPRTSRVTVMYCEFEDGKESKPRIRKLQT